MNTKKKTIEGNSNDEVEQLLQAAQDEMMLKLSVDSHMSRVAPNYLHSDLDRRFQALKSRPSTISKPPKSQQQQQQQKKTFHDDVNNNNKVGVVVDEELKAVLGGNDDVDLSARFAALKASLSSSSSTSNDQVHVGPNISDGQNQNENSDDDDDEDEVEKVIKWAIDAARLDPSPLSDDEHDTDDDDDKDSDDDQPAVDRKKEHRKYWEKVNPVEDVWDTHGLAAILGCKEVWELRSLQHLTRLCWWSGYGTMQWKGIAYEQSGFVEGHWRWVGFVFDVGDGRRIRFWSIFCSGDAALNFIFPNLIL